jgi:hypothetical protein
VKELQERVRRTRRKPDFTVDKTPLAGVKESGGKINGQGLQLFHSPLMTCRITIKLQLTGKFRLIFKFYYVISYGCSRVARDFTAVMESEKTKVPKLKPTTTTRICNCKTTLQCITSNS